MSKAERKIILAVAGFEKSNLGALFIEQGYTILSELSPETEKDCQFIIDDYQIENNKYARVRTTRKLSKLPNERAFIDGTNLTSNAKQLLKNYFNDSEELDLIDRYSKDIKDLFTIKIQDYLNIGYFVDTIIVEAYKAQFDVESMRKYLNETIEYTFRLIEGKGSLLPIEVSFSHDGERFVVQVATTVKDFKLESDFFNHKKSSVDVIKRANYFDMTYIESRDRLLISSLWFKEKTEFNCNFYTIVEKRKIGFKSNTNVVVPSGEEKVNYQPHEAQDRSDLTVAGIIRKLVLFIRNNHKNDSSFDYKKMTLEQVKAEVFQYPITSEVEDLNEHTYQKVLDLLKAGVEEEDLVRIISGGENNKEINTRVSGKIEEENFKQVVKGQEEEKDNTQYKISGEENNEEENLKVKTIQNDLEVKYKDLEAKFKESELRNQKNIEQNSKMKKLIEGMKLEYLKLKAEKGTSKNNTVETSNSSVSEIVQSNGDSKLTEQLIELKNKERQWQKAKTDFETLNTSKDIKIAQLESKLENFKSEFYKSDEFNIKEKVHELEAENKTLLSKVDLMTKNITAMANNNSIKENDVINKKEKEVETLKNQMKMAHALIQKFKTEKSEQEEKYKAEIDELRRMKLENYEKTATDKVSDNHVALSPAKAQSNNEEIQQQFEEKINQLIAEKKIAEDKFKEQGLELKKIEHKLKITATQLDEAHKKNARPEKAKANSNDAYIRQLEFANKKLTEVSEDLTEKKREMLKFKQENQQLTTKVAELEKKLAQSDKKAA